jgi:acetolactate synthase regulatory subunit
MFVIWFPSFIRCNTRSHGAILYKIRLAKRPMEVLQHQHTKKKCSRQCFVEYRKNDLCIKQYRIITSYKVKGFHMCSCNMKIAKRVKSANRIHLSCVHSSRKQQLLSARGDGGYCVTNRSSVCAVPQFCLRLSPFKIIVTVRLIIPSR